MIFVSKVQDLVRIRSRVAMRDVVLWRFSRLSNAESQLIFRGLTARRGGHDMLQVHQEAAGPPVRRAYSGLVIQSAPVL